MVDTGDLKSPGRNAVPVRVRPRVPINQFLIVRETEFVASHLKFTGIGCANDLIHVSARSPLKTHQLSGLHIVVVYAVKSRCTLMEHVLSDAVSKALIVSVIGNACVIKGVTSKRLRCIISMAKGNS